MGVTSLRQTFGDGRLSDSCVSDQDGVVLRSSRENPDASSDLLVTTDDGVELPTLCLCCQIAGVL